MRRILFVIGLIGSLFLLALIPTASLAGFPVETSARVLPMMRAPKFDAHLRAPHEGQIINMLREHKILGPDAGSAEVRAAVDEFMREWARRNPTTPNPEKFRQLLRNERLAAEAGKSPKALGLTMADPIMTLVALVEFPATDTFIANLEDPETGECVDVEVTTSGPLHNEIVLGPRDNNTVWFEDATPELYDELYFGTTGVVINHPNLGPVDCTGMTVANYYLEQSEGAFAPEGYVYPKWLQAAHSEGWYGADSCETGSVMVRARDLVMEVVDLINADDPEFPWQDFDADGDGKVDNFTIIHAGMGQEAGGGAQGDFAIWSHAASVGWPDGYLACTAGSPGCPDRDIYVLHYSMDPENFDVGVGAEEFGHAVFGLPDIYTTDYANSVANWAIMSAGSWNGPLGGMQPAPFPGWFRYILGWWDPVELNYDGPEAEVVIGQHSLRPEGTEYGMKINLPDAVRWLADPYSGEYMWWGNMGDLMDNAVRRTVDLTGYSTASLGFWTFYEIEEGWDFGFVQVSTDGGVTWTSLENPHTTYEHNPAAIETVVANLPGFTGHSDGWVYEEFDLTPYAGQEFLLQFRYITDWAYTERGFFIDDITITADGEVIFFDDVEAGPGDWIADPEDGWIITTGTLSGIQYYLVEWRNYSGFDEGLKYPYETVWFDEDEWEVDRVPYTVPGMLLWHRNALYDFDYTLGDSWFDPPSLGPKHALIVVDSHPFPYMWDEIQYVTGQGVRLGGRRQACDAAFTLQDTTPFTIRRGYTWVDDVLGYVPEIQETKTFGPRPPVSEFHDYLGYYPGLWCCWEGYLIWWDIDASAVIPAKANYTTKITWPDNSPAYPLYGYDIGVTVLGDGNPWDAGYGVNLVVEEQAEDGSWGQVRFFYRETTGETVTIPAAASDTGYVFSRDILENHFGSAAMWTGFAPSGADRGKYYGAVQFDLSDIPPEAHILAAEVELAPWSANYLNRSAGGSWTLNLLSSDVDPGWQGKTYWDIAVLADVEATIGPALSYDDLGVVNTFTFDMAQLLLLADRVATTGKASFRLDYEATHPFFKDIYGWSSPVLRVTYFVEP